MVLRAAVIIAAVFVVFLLVMVMIGGGGSEPEVKVCSSSDAPFYAEQAVEKMLKNPDEADFTSWSTWTVKPIGAQYEVTGQVTATNSFNAKIKSTFKAIVRCDGGEWYLGRVTIE